MSMNVAMVSKAATEPHLYAPDHAPNAMHPSAGFGDTTSSLSADVTSTPGVDPPSDMQQVGVIAASVSTVIIVLVAAGILLRSHMRRKVKIVDDKMTPSEPASIPPEGSSFNLLNFATARGSLKFNQQGPIPSTPTLSVQSSRLAVPSGIGHSEPEPPRPPQNALNRAASVMSVASTSSRGEATEGLLPETNFPEFFSPLLSSKSTSYLVVG